MCSTLIDAPRPPVSRASIPTPWETPDLPGSVPMPTMLTPREIRYLGWLGRDWFSGAGEVVDLGCFLGGSTNALLQGLRRNSAWSGRTVKVYDSFIADAHAARAYDIHRAEGESFRAVFDRLNAPSAGEMVVREGWIPSAVDGEAGEALLYPERAPIEVLHIDVAKRWEVHRTILRVFGRRLIPGRAMVAQQDFKHWYAYWLPLDMWMLRDVFEPTHDVPNSATVGFLYRGGLDDGLDRLPVPGALDGPELERVWRQVEAYWESWGSREAVFMCGLQATRGLAHAAAAPQAAVAQIERTLGRAEAHAFDALPWLPFEDLDGALASLRPIVDERRFAALRERAGALRERFVRGQRDLIAGVRATIAERLRASGATEWALYGAGRDAAAILADGWRPNGTQIEAVLDDAPRVAHVDGVRVIHPSLLGENVRAVVIGSSVHRRDMLSAIDRWPRARDVRVIDPFR